MIPNALQIRAPAKLFVVESASALTKYTPKFFFSICELFLDQLRFLSCDFVTMWAALTQAMFAAYFSPTFRGLPRKPTSSQGSEGWVFRGFWGLANLQPELANLIKMARIWY